MKPMSKQLHEMNMAEAISEVWRRAKDRRRKRLVRGICETCKLAGVEKVMAADHHGMIFLLSEGPKQIGGIVYRNDEMNHVEIKSLAAIVNVAISPNVEAWRGADSPRPKGK